MFKNFMFKNSELTKGEINNLKSNVVYFRTKIHPDYETSSDGDVVLPSPEEESQIISDALGIDLITVMKVMYAHDQVLIEYDLLH